VAGIGELAATVILRNLSITEAICGRSMCITSR
jgi:hypothetical protein